jgi:hypothetical protein
MVNKSSLPIKIAIALTISICILTTSADIVTPVAGMTTSSETSASPSSFLSSSISSSIGHSACDNQTQSNYCRDITYGTLDSIQPVSQSTTDSDGDGINNTRERQLGTDPNSIDSDNDGIGDATETNVDKRLIQTMMELLMLLIVIQTMMGFLIERKEAQTQGNRVLN